MIKSLTLVNFKKHENLRIDFTAGLTALKGSNEAGKSTIYHSVLYAMFGARALPMSLAETVTYLKPESSLKVTLTFSHANIDYTIVRSKSGCELTATGLTVNGQAEVTKYVENLLGVSADAATKLMIASQNGLRGALESKSAVPLIEKLSNLGLIDDLVGKIQDQLPSGNTKLMAATVATLANVKAPVADFTSQMLAISELTTQYGSVNAKMADIEEKLEKLNVAEASACVTLRLKQEADLANHTASLNRLYRRFDQVPLVFDEQVIRTLEAYIAEEALDRVTRSKYRAFTSEYKPATQYRTLVEDLPTTVANCEASLREVNNKLKATAVTSATLKATKILEKVCGLCGKDLQDVPEVVKKNLDNDAQLLKLNADTAILDIEAARLNSELSELREIAKATAKVELLLANYKDYVSKVSPNEMVPAVLEWCGPVPDLSDVLPDYAASLAKAQSDKRAADLDAAERKAATLEIDRLEALKASITLEDTSTAYITLENFGVLTANRGLVTKEQQAVEKAMAQANNDLLLAKGLHQSAVTIYESQCKQRDELQELIGVYETNNELIKKLREARPIVAGRLWATVLTSISRYFSDVRGVQSVVSMKADGFLVDGKPAEALSGSTLDSLGLAIRIALGKTFLPSVDFLMLDEPGSGMDEERETAMLGVLATCNYSQVLVVTHSELADTFATSVVQL